MGQNHNVCIRSPLVIPTGHIQIKNYTKNPKIGTCQTHKRWLSPKIFRVRVGLEPVCSLVQLGNYFREKFAKMLQSNQLPENFWKVHILKVWWVWRILQHFLLSCKNLAWVVFNKSWIEQKRVMCHTTHSGVIFFTILVCYTIQLLFESQSSGLPKIFQDFFRFYLTLTFLKIGNVSGLWARPFQLVLTKLHSTCPKDLIERSFSNFFSKFWIFSDF